MRYQSDERGKYFLSHVVASLHQGMFVSCTIQKVKLRLRTNFKTLKKVSMCHRLLGAKRSAAKLICVVMPSLNSLSATSKNARSSRIRTRTFCSLINAYESSRARRRIDISPSLRQSKMMFRCRKTAFVSIDTTLLRVFSATYLSLAQ